jgi:hypothetical protein
MFASLISRLPAPLRRALAYAKAFAFLEEPPAALPRHRSERPAAAVVTDVAPATMAPGTTTATDAPAVCPTDRRRRAPGVRPAVTLTAQLRSCGAGSSPHARRGGAVSRSKQICRTPTNGRPVTTRSTATEDRRGAVAGGFLHR